MKLRAVGVALLALLPAIAHAADTWPSYLDYAYIYASADTETLRARLSEYGREANIRLEDYVVKQYADLDSESADEVDRRRAAIAHLLLYLSTNEPIY